jgi:hypothetical protein
VVVGVEDRVVRLELAEEVVGVEERDGGGLFEALAAWITCQEVPLG